MPKTRWSGWQRDAACLSVGSLVRFIEVLSYVASALLASPRTRLGLLSAVSERCREVLSVGPSRSLFDHAFPPCPIRARQQTEMLRRTSRRKLRVPGHASPVRVETGFEKRLPPMHQALQSLPAYRAVPESAKTLPSVWSAPSLLEAWRCLDLAVRSVGDDGARDAILKNDLVMLSQCTSEAEIEELLFALPRSVRSQLLAHSSYSPVSVEEIFVHLGQNIEVRGGSWHFTLPQVSPEDLQRLLTRIGRFSDDGRGNISSTLHRVSCWRGKRGEIVGVTLRVGRFAPNCGTALLPLALKGSLLILSRPGAGKTTVLRDIAASLARLPSNPRVVVIDTSNEIGGDSAIPLPFLGRARRVQVPRRSEQLRVMTEVLQNHTPEFIVVDEIGTQQEAEAAWSISQRGIRLVATCHGESLSTLLQNRELNLLVGGVSHAFLSNEERRMRNKVRKTVLERTFSSPFSYVAELTRRNYAAVYTDVNRAVDLILNDQDARLHADLCSEVDLREAFVPVSNPQVATATDSEGYVTENVVDAANRPQDDLRRVRRGAHRHHIARSEQERKQDIFNQIDSLQL